MITVYRVNEKTDISSGWQFCRSLVRSEENDMTGLSSQEGDSYSNYFSL